MDRDTSTEKAFFELNHAQVFVYVLMTVISILFLFITNTYLFRMNFQDWSPMPIPTLLWFNTACLLLASIGMAWSKSGGINRASRDFLWITRSLILFFVRAPNA